MKLKKLQNFNLVDHLKQYFKITPYQDIISWAEKNIDFSDDVSAERNKLDFNLYPYQIPILKEWQNEGKKIKTIVVVAPEQTGKTNMFAVGNLYNMVFNPCQSLIVYPNDQLAIATNQTKFLPLMRHIPLLKQQLQKPKSCRSDCYKFSNLISYFQGGGSKIVSKSCKIVIMDEVDAIIPPPNTDPVADLKKRTRSYNSSICFLISTPTVQSGRIWKNFLKGSQGYWHLRCKGCGELTIRSCDIHNLQFESDLNQQLGQRIVRADSIRLICPKCGHEHTEADKNWMNVNGGFVHLLPERLETAPSFQIGALASQLPSLCWQNIAQAQLEAGKRADVDAQITFDNSFRGLPYKRRQIVKQDLERLQDHQYKSSQQQLKKEDIEFIYITADTMDDYFRYGVFASDVKDNIHVLQLGELKYLQLDPDERAKIDKVGKEEAQFLGQKYQPVETMEDLLNKEYFGYKPILAMIDSRGHRTKEIQDFTSKNTNVCGWYGTKLQNVRYKPSQNLVRSFLVSHLHYKVETIYYLYSQKRRDGEYLFFYNDIEKKYLDEIAAVKADPNTKFGHVPANWTSQNRADHAFDCLKMAYFTRDLCIQNLKKDRFNYAQSPRLKRRFEPNLKKEVLKTRKQIEDKKRESNQNWLNLPESWMANRGDI